MDLREQASKMIVLIADAPPHEYGNGESLAVLNLNLASFLSRQTFTRLVNITSGIMLPQFS